MSISAAEPDASTRKTAVTIISEQETVQTRVQDAEGGAGGNLDKVRDLLFGGQMRDYERKFARLEDRLVKETADLRDELKKRFAALEAYMKAEIESLTDRLRTEQDARLGSAKDLARALSDTAQQFEQKTSQLDDLIARTQRDLRQQLHAVHQELGDDIRQRVEDVLSRLTQEAGDLRSDKADRNTLAALLTDMAMRLTAEGRPAASESDAHG
jgi:DNA repair exonuclease SbcCD ATPase subunit